jgi:hypothetical protein
MFPSTSPLSAVYNLFEKKQYKRAVALANYYPQSNERCALECIALLIEGETHDAATLMPDRAEELPSLALTLKKLSTALGIGWEFLDLRVNTGDNPYLKYLCLDLIGASKHENKSLIGYGLRILARRGIQNHDWLFAGMCLERAMEVDGSPLCLIEATKLVLRMRAEPASGGVWHGRSPLDLVTEAAYRVNRNNSQAELLLDAASLLSTLDPAAEARTVELVRQAGAWFPAQRRLILDKCVHLAGQIKENRVLLAAQIARTGADLVGGLAEYLQERAANLDRQLCYLVEERHVYSNASWYREGHELRAVLQLLDLSTDERITTEILRLVDLSDFPAIWRAEWLIHALARRVQLTDSIREAVLRLAETLPKKKKQALIRALNAPRRRGDYSRGGKIGALIASRIAGMRQLLFKTSRRRHVSALHLIPHMVGLRYAVECMEVGRDLLIDGRASPRKKQKPPKKRRVGRYTRIQFPMTCELEKKAELKIQLTTRQPTETRVRRKVVWEVKGETKEIELTVCLTAPGFATDSRVRIMKMPVEGDSEEVVFPLFPLKVGAQTLEVEVFHEAKRLTYLLIRTCVENDRYQNLMRGIDVGSHDAGANRASIAVVEQFHSRLRQRRPRCVEATDRRILHVTWLESEDKLAFRVMSPQAIEDCRVEHLRPGLHHAVCDELRKLNEFLFDVVTQNTPTDEEWDSLQLNLRAKGLSLSELLLPPALLQQIREWPAESTLVVDTNEQWIPWEILHDGADFLGLRFVLARMPRYDHHVDSFETVQRQSRPRRTLSRVVNVVGGEVEEKHADRAARTFMQFSPPLRVDTLREEPISSLGKALSGADALHLTCHGQVEPHLLQIAKSTSQALNLLPDSVRVLPLKRGSVVFANSCGSDRALVMFGSFTSFGWEFYRHGADVFIGTLGSVPTAHALYFAEQLYMRLLGNVNGATVGTIVNEARHMAGTKRNLFSLLYCLYGDPDTLIRCRRRQTPERTTPGSVSLEVD